MNGKIRIAQISDVLISAGLEAEESRLERLADFIKRNRPSTARLDYLVVCGNVTADGTPESFALASNFLNRLAYDILDRPDIGIDPNRLLLVPGPNDVQLQDTAAPDFTRFAQFYEHLYSHERWLHKAESFDPRKATLRHLKDLTLVGLTYWGEGNQEERLSDFQTQIDSIRSSGPLQFKYVKRAPTLLVSAGLPPISRLALTRREFRNLISFVRESLGTTIYLFGAGDYELIPPQLSGFQHLCLGTGPQALCPPGTPPPFRVNLIELPALDCLDCDAQQPEAPPRISLYRRRSPEAEPVDQSYSAEELRPWIRRLKAPPSLPDVNARLLSRLWAAIDWRNGQFIWVYGLPGNGRFKPFEQDYAMISLDGREAPCFTKELRGTRDQALKSLKDLKSLIRKHRPREPKIVVVIRDLLLGEMSVGERESYKDDLNKELTPLKDSRFSIFYISNAVGEKIDYDLELKDFPHRQPLVCEPLDNVLMAALDSHYVHRLPFQQDRVDNLTGRYAGLSLEIFAWAEQVFGRLSGAVPIRQDTYGALLADALHHQPANGSPSNAYLLAVHIHQTLIRTPIGAAVVAFIRWKVLQAKLDLNWLRAGAEPRVVSFSLSEIVAAVRQEIPLVVNFLKALVRHSVLLQPSEEEYRVRVFAPFLIDLRWAPSIAAVQEPPMPKSRFMAFLSYRSVSSDIAHRIAVLLRKGFESRGGLDLFLFEDLQKDPASIEERINRELLARRNLIILHEGGMKFGGEGWQERELYFWRQTWAPKEGTEAGISVYVKPAEILLPPSLANQNVLSLASANDEDVFGYAEGRLIPESGGVIGLRPQHELGLSEAGRG